MEVIRCSRK